MVNATNNLYDLTNISTSKNLYEFVKYTNDLTGQYFVSGILIANFIITFIALKNYGNKEAMTTSSFITASLSILFSALDLIPNYITIIFVLIFGITFAFIYTRRE